MKSLPEVTKIQAVLFREWICKLILVDFSAFLLVFYVSFFKIVKKKVFYSADILVSSLSLLINF